MVPLVSHAQALLGTPLQNVKALHGGDLSDVLSAAIPSGERVVFKGGPAPLIEADMLRALRAADTPAPKVIAAEETVLVMEHNPSGGSLGDCWASLGEVLRRQHTAVGHHYGWSDDYAFGAVKIDNTHSENWPEFWAQRRLLCHADAIPSGLMNRIDRLCERLGDHLPAHPPASLLHGDLWSGNILCKDDRISALIDPACSYGHSEVDLTMLCLFSPPSAAFWESYGANPAAPDFQTRQAIYQLWPALVHVRLFGSGYHSLVDQCLKAVGA